MKLNKQQKLQYRYEDSQLQPRRGAILQRWAQPIGEEQKEQSPERAQSVNMYELIRCFTHPMTETMVAIKI